jgi:hypothetical protein
MLGRTRCSRQGENAMAAIDLDRALLDPAAVFATPRDVVAHAALSREQKIEILRRWEYDANELDVAEEEGMAGGEKPRLRQIMLALEELGVDFSERSGPSKHHGA